MKAISSIIVIMLMVIISIIVFVGAYFTFLDVAKTSATGSEEAIEKGTIVLGQKLSVDNVYNNEFYIRNIGNVAVKGDELAIFVNGQQVDIITYPETIESKQIGKFVLNESQIGEFSGKAEVKITAAGLGDTQIVTFPSPTMIVDLSFLPVKGSFPNFVRQNRTFTVNANVTCIGRACGNINAAVRYNSL